MKQFARETEESEKLTELDFILMAIVYDIEKERVGVSHINRTPLLDVPMTVSLSPSEAVTLRTRASCEKWGSTFARSPASTTRFPEGVRAETPASTGTYPSEMSVLFLHATLATLIVVRFLLTRKERCVRPRPHFCIPEALRSIPEVETMGIAGVET